MHKNTHYLSRTHTCTHAHSHTSTHIHTHTHTLSHARIQAHTEALRAWTYGALTKLRHTNGAPIVEVYGKHARPDHLQVLHGRGVGQISTRQAQVTIFLAGNDYTYGMLAVLKIRTQPTLCLACPWGWVGPRLRLMRGMRGVRELMCAWKLLGGVTTPSPWLAAARRVQEQWAHHDSL